MTLQNRLLGALIGLVRATENNEDKRTDETNRLVRDVLADRLTPLWADEAHLTGLLDRVRTEKRRLVPDCFVCRKPCGRTDDYDMAQLDTASPMLRNVKRRILEGCSQRAAKLTDADPSLYRAVYALGLDEWSLSYLQTIAAELDDS